MAEIAPGRGQPQPAHSVHVDPADQMAFLDRHLLEPEQGFVCEGGAKLKLLLGATGAGKTHFLAAAMEQGRARGFLTVGIDASRVSLAGFDHLYRAIAANLDLEDMARRFVLSTLRAAGYHDLVLQAGHTLAGWCEATSHEAGPLRVRLQEELHRELERNADLDVGYAIGLARWCEQVAWGQPPEDPMAEGLTEQWLRGEKVGQRDCNRLRLRRCLDRFSARLWLRSLVHFVRQSGFPGLVVTVDNLGVLLERPRPTPHLSAPEQGVPPAPSPPPHYTPQKIADFYEMLRTLVDEMGLLPGFLLLLAAPPELLTDERHGIPSYVALAERLRTEVDTVELNRFADTIVLERLWATDPGAGRQLAERVAESVLPGPDAGLRERAVAAAMAQWQVRDVDVSAVRRSVLAVLRAAEGGAESEPHG